MSFQSDPQGLLQTKLPLSFRPDGSYRILLLSDLQCEENGDPRTLAAIERMVDVHCPDLVLWGGDNPYGAADRAGLIRLIGKFAAPMERRGIPWAVTFGNHDEAACPTMTEDEIEAVYETEFSCCVTGHVPGLHGQSNYVLPVHSHDGARIALAVWSLDSGRNLADMNRDFYRSGDIVADSRPPVMPVSRQRFDIVRFDQLVWYWNTSLALEAANGRIPGILLTHTCPHEARIIKENPAETGMVGDFDENVSPGPINSGLFAAALQRGDLMGIYYGHNHRNTAEGTYCGIRLGYIGCIGYDAYGFKSDIDAERNRLRGARLLTFREEDVGNYASEFLPAAEYLSAHADA